MAINENTGPELEEYQQQPPVTINHQILASSNVYLRQNQQEESYSPSDFTNDTNSPSSSISLSNKGNQSLSASTVEKLVDIVEEDKSVKENHF